MILAEFFHGKGVSDFKTELIKLPCGDALKISYSINDGTAMDMTQYYICLSSIVIVTVGNMGEELTPSIDEVGNYMLYTLKEV